MPAPGAVPGAMIWNHRPRCLGGLEAPGSTEAVAGVGDPGRRPVQPGSAQRIEQEVTETTENQSMAKRWGRFRSSPIGGGTPSRDVVHPPFSPFSPVKIIRLFRAILSPRPENPRAGGFLRARTMPMPAPGAVPGATIRGHRPRLQRRPVQRPHSRLLRYVDAHPLRKNPRGVDSTSESRATGP